jgi:peptide/nickel transport system ATP-binding protein
VEVLRAHLPLTRAEARTRAADLLARVSIPEPARALAAYPHQFSGGQAQRIAIALAIAAGPRLLIADEATSALDVLVQAEIVALLRELCDDSGMTLLFITHDVALAGTLADRVAVMHAARLVEVGAARDVIERPLQPYTRSLIAAHLDLASPVLVAGTPS